MPSAHGSVLPTVLNVRILCLAPASGLVPSSPRHLPRCSSLPPAIQLEVASHSCFFEYLHVRSRLRWGRRQDGTRKAGERTVAGTNVRTCFDNLSGSAQLARAIRTAHWKRPDVLLLESEGESSVCGVTNRPKPARNQQAGANARPLQLLPGPFSVRRSRSSCSVRIRPETN